MYGRSELDVYPTMAKEMTNTIIYPQGGAARRPGTEFIASEVFQLIPGAYADLDEKCRIIPYVRSKEEAYCILIRANTDGSAYTQTTNCDISAVQVSQAGSDPSNGYRANTTAFSGRRRTKLPFADVSWIENYGTVSAIPNAKQFVGYTEDQLDDLKFLVAGDFIILTHPEVPPLFIQYLGNFVSGSFVAYPFYLTPVLTSIGFGSSTVDSVSYPSGNWPYRSVNSNSAHTLAFSATTGSVTVTSSKTFFESTHIGAHFILSAGGVFEITAVASGTSATGQVLTTLSSTGATANWLESAWSDYRGWPRCATYHQGRLIYGGNSSDPVTIVGSKLGDIRTLYTGATGDSDPLRLTIDSEDSSQIQWMASGKNLSIGTLSREYIAFAPDDTATFSGTNFSFSPESANGSSYVQAVKVGNAVTFVDRDTRTVREFLFNFQEDSFRADAISFAAEHMPFKSREEHADAEDPRIIRMAWQGGQSSCLWFVDNNGGLFACTRVREININGWHYHRLGGTLEDEQCKVEDVCVIPNVDGTHDDVWLVVHRTINGSNIRMIERIPQQFRRPDLDYNPAGGAPTYHQGLMSYADCQWTSEKGEESSATSVSEFSWFDHLVGEEVDVVLDGKYEGRATVQSDGSITTPEVGERVIVGLPYRGIITTMPIEAGSQLGSGQSSIQKIDRAVVRFQDTVSAKIGRTPLDENEDEDIDDLLEDVIFRRNTVPMDSYTPLFNGLKDLEIRSIHSRDNTVTIVHDDPVPFAVTSIAMRGVTYD